MLLIDPAEQHLMRRLVMPPVERGVFFCELVERGRQANIVLAIARHDRDRAVARCRALPDRFFARRGLVDPEQRSGAGDVHFGDGCDIAGLDAGGFFGGAALDKKQPADAGRLTVAGDKLGAFGKRGAPDARQREPADRIAVRHLENIGGRPRYPQALGGRLGIGAFVAQQLEQPPDAKAGLRRTEEQRHDLPMRRLAGEIGENRLGARHFIGDQLFEQRVVMIGELFEHMGAFLRLAFRKLGGNVDRFGRATRPVAIGALQREIDKADDLVSFAPGDLPGDERGRAGGFERGEQRADRSTRLIHLVHEHRMRNAVGLKPTEERLGEKGALRIGVDDDQRHVGGGQGGIAVSRKADRSRRVDDHEALPQKFQPGEIDFGGAAPGTGFGAGIPHARSGGDIALSAHRACREQQRFHQAGLACSGWPHQGDDTRGVFLFHASSPWPENTAAILPNAAGDDVPTRGTL